MMTLWMHTNKFLKSTITWAVKSDPIGMSMGVLRQRIKEPYWISFKSIEADTNLKFQVEEAFKKFDTSGDQRWVWISVNFDF